MVICSCKMSKFYGKWQLRGKMAAPSWKCRKWFNFTCGRLLEQPSEIIYAFKRHIIAVSVIFVPVRLISKRFYTDSNSLNHREEDNYLPKRGQLWVTGCVFARKNSLDVNTKQTNKHGKRRHKGIYLLYFTSEPTLIICKTWLNIVTSYCTRDWTLF